MDDETTETTTGTAEMATETTTEPTAETTEPTTETAETTTETATETTETTTETVDDDGCGDGDDDAMMTATTARMSMKRSTRKSTKKEPKVDQKEALDFCTKSIDFGALLDAHPGAPPCSSFGTKTGHQNDDKINGQRQEALSQKKRFGILTSASSNIRFTT